DLSFYLNEILEQQGEVNVPGLGYFVRVRVSGHYNDEEAKFYPPHNEVQFEPKNVDADETFASYVANKKDISLSSSKFFTGQFINNLLQDAAIKETEVGELGWLRADRSKLTFKPKISTKNDPDFFGLPELSLNKIGDQPAESDPIPELSLTIASDPKEQPDEPAEAEPEDTFDNAYQENSFEEEEYYEEKRGLNIKLIAMIIVGVLIAATASLYFYDPSIFGVNEKRKPLVVTSAPQIPAADSAPQQTASAKATTAQAAAVKTDTTAQSATKQEVLITDASQNIPLDVPVQKTLVDAQTQAAIAENTDELPWHPTYAIIGGTFSGKEQAEDAVDEFKARGVEAHVIEQGKSKKQLVVIGSYQTHAEADAALRELKRVRKARKDIYIKELK
ncbi:MAG: SPOR domain-containing protein, partial [Sphingobacteriales bacterium]